MSTRKITSVGMEIKAPRVYDLDLELEDKGEAAVCFVPIVTGTYRLCANGFEKTGTVVTFTVK